MIINTRVFGEVEIDDDKIIKLENGIIGFPDLKRFAMLHNEEKSDGRVAWLVSIEEPAFALPVIDPLSVCPDYNPIVEDELLKPLGTLNPDDMLVLVTLTVPKGNPEKMTVNLKAPFIINAENTQGVQVILDDNKYEIKFPVYDILKALKEKEGK